MLAIRRSHGECLVMRFQAGAVVIQFSVLPALESTNVTYQILAKPDGISIVPSMQGDEIRLDFTSEHEQAYMLIAVESTRAKVGIDAPRSVNIVRAEVLASPEKTAKHAAKLAATEVPV